MLINVSMIANEPIVTTCAGEQIRVFMHSQIIHFDTTKKRKDYKWIHGINSFLLSDILVKNIFHVDEDFHARYSALDRTYRYIILNQNIHQHIC